MKGLLTLMMRGRTQAVMGAVVTAMLALLITPFSVVSTGLVVLATVRNGPREGLLVVLMSTLALAVLGMLIFHMPLVLGGLGLVLWLPAWGLAIVLGRSASLMRALETAALAGFVLVGLQYLALGDPAAFWQGLLQDYLDQALDAAVVAESDQQKVLQMLAGWMPGGVAASWVLSMVFGLMFGRWGQAVMDGSDGFGREFRSLRISRFWLLLLPVLLGLSLIGDGPNIAGQFYLVGIVLFLFQGLAVAHGLVAATGASPGWLFGVYFLMFVGLPHSVTAIAAAGYADGWLDFRAKVRGTRKPPGPEQ